MTTIQEIAQKRKEAEEAKVAAVDAQGAVDITPEYKEYQRLLNIEQEKRHELAILEAQYKFDCVKAYNETREKKYPGGQIKLYTKLDYKDFDAREWSMKQEVATGRAFL